MCQMHQDLDVSVPASRFVTSKSYNHSNFGFENYGDVEYMIRVWAFV